jgi:hypothetical protein
VLSNSNLYRYMEGPPQGIHGGQMQGMQGPPGAGMPANMPVGSGMPSMVNVHGGGLYKLRPIA